MPRFPEAPRDRVSRLRARSDRNRIRRTSRREPPAKAQKRTDELETGSEPSNFRGLVPLGYAWRVLSESAYQSRRETDNRASFSPIEVKSRKTIAGSVRRRDVFLEIAKAVLPGPSSPGDLRRPDPGQGAPCLGSALRERSSPGFGIDSRRARFACYLPLPTLGGTRKKGDRGVPTGALHTDACVMRPSRRPRSLRASGLLCPPRPGRCRLRPLHGESVPAVARMVPRQGPAARLGRSRVRSGSRISHEAAPVPPRAGSVPRLVRQRAGSRSADLPADPEPGLADRGTPGREGPSDRSAMSVDRACYGGRNARAGGDRPAVRLPVAAAAPAVARWYPAKPAIAHQSDF